MVYSRIQDENEAIHSHINNFILASIGCSSLNDELTRNDGLTGVRAVFKKEHSTKNKRNVVFTFPHNNENVEKEDFVTLEICG